MSDDAANYVRIEVDIVADGQTFTYSQCGVGSYVCIRGYAQ